MNCKKNSVVRRSAGADPVIIFPANNKVGIYVLNADVVPPLELDTGWYGLTCMPEDFPDETTLDMLESAFPEANGRNLLRLEDHIRHESVTLVCECDRDDAEKIISELQPLKANLSVKTMKVCRKKNRNPNMLPDLNGGQWKVCMKCPYFSLEDRTGRCSKRWVCKWAAAPVHEWNIDVTPGCFHSQCQLLERHFRFEAAMLCYTDRFKDDVLKEDDPEYFFSERERLLHRDLAAAAQESNFSRIKRRCSELGKSFAEFAAGHDIFSKMLNFWKVNRRLVENVRLILSEGIAIPPEWRADLLTLSGEDDLVRELHQLLGQFEQ